MPDESVPDESVPDESVPDSAEADGSEPDPLRPLDPGTLAPDAVRRAPRFGAFIVAGALVGVVLGVLLATVLGSGELTNGGGVLPVLAGANGARAVTAVGVGGVGALVGGALALALDARSRRRVR